MNWSSFVFAHTLKARLRHGVVDSLGQSHFLVRGTLDAGAVLAKIEILVTKNLHWIIQNPPRVWCRAPWMRSEPDWHNDREGGMCWVLKNEWRDILTGDGRQPRDLVDVATGWLLHNVKSLVSRHHYGNLVGLKAWPKEWDAWPHYDKGVKQYERTKRNKRDSRADDGQ